MPETAALAAQLANPAMWWNAVQDQFSNAVNQVMTPVATPIPIAEAADHGADHQAIGDGAVLYTQACAACHGPDGHGVANLAPTLVDSPVLAERDDAGVLEYIRTGVLLDNPNNKSGLVMPPSGGRPDLTDEQLLSIIAYLRAGGVTPQ